MITSHGYIIDGLDRLTVDDLECTLRDLKNAVLDLLLFPRRRLICDYILELTWRYNAAIEFTPEFETRLRRANEILMRDAEKAIREAYKVYKECHDSLGDNDELRDVMVEVKLSIPDLCHDDGKVDVVSDDIDYGLWSVYQEEINSEYGPDIMKCSLGAGSYVKDCHGVDDVLRYHIWGADHDEEITGWACDCHLPEHIERGDYRYSWPFHNILSHCNFPLKWLVLINEYDYEVKIRYSKGD